MFKKGIKTILILSILLSNCNSTKKLNTDIHLRYKKYIKSNFSNYSVIRKIVKDSLDKWKDEKLEYSKYYLFKPYQIDSLVFVNQNHTQLVTTLNKKSIFKDSNSDACELIIGNKVSENWYFYFSGTTVLPHDYYQDSTYSNFTWDELGYLAYRNFLQGYLKFRKDGSYYVNEKAFERYRTPEGFHAELSEEQKDSLTLSLLADLFIKKIDPKEYNDIQESITNSVRPSEPPKDPNDKTVKIFESEAWKNRYKNKN